MQVERTDLILISRERIVLEFTWIRERVRRMQSRVICLSITTARNDGVDVILWELSDSRALVGTLLADQ